MPRVPWLDVPRTGSHRLFVGRVPIEANDLLTSPALKAAQNLAARACYELRLEGRYAFQISRADGAEVQICFETTEDATKFAAAAGIGDSLADGRAMFSFDPVWKRLQAIAGAPSGRAGFDKRKHDQAAAIGLSWADQPFRSKAQRRETF